MNLPQHLLPKPIVTVNDYDKIDGQYILNTGVCALSICQSTWDDNQISMKVWRHIGKRWSRKSEEFTIGRCLDLAILFLASLKKDQDLSYPTCSLQLFIDRDDLLMEGGLK